MAKSAIQLVDEMLGSQDRTDRISANELSILLQNIEEDFDSFSQFATEVEKELNFN